MWLRERVRRIGVQPQTIQPNLGRAMFSEEVEDLLMSLGKTITEIHFAKLPNSAVLDLLCEEHAALEIHLDLDSPMRLSEGGDGAWHARVVSARLESDGFCDWKSIDYFPQLRELELTVTPYDANQVDRRDLAAMHSALLNLTHLRHLVIDTSGYETDASAQIRATMNFPGLPCVHRSEKKGQKKRRTPGE